MSSKIRDINGNYFRPGFLHLIRPTYSDTSIIAEMSESSRNMLEEIGTILVKSSELQFETLRLLKRIDRRLSRLEGTSLKRGR